MKNRIWELDALRGVMIWCVVAIHLIFDLYYFLGIDVVRDPVLQYCIDRCGFLFVVLSGVSVTLGTHPVRRGLQVFGCGMVITAVTVGMYLMGMADDAVMIWFGVLHLLGICMMLWPVFGRLPVWALVLCGALFVVFGVWMRTVQTSTMFLVPLGLTFPGFETVDYFPLFPHLGWFLFGAALGKTLYRKKTTKFPWCGADSLPVRFFRFCGRRSIWIYLIHQPVLYGVLMLV